MAGITLAQAEAKLALWLAAEEAAIGSKAYTIGSRSLTRHDLTEIKDQIEYWNRMVMKLSAASTGRRGPRYGITG